MKVGQVINCLASPITVKRKDRGYYVKGVWHEPDPEEFTMMANVQPTAPKDLQLLPEGLRTTESIRVYSQDPLRTADAPDKTPADVIVYKETDYEVHTVTDWSDIGGYYRSIAVKMGQ